MLDVQSILDALTPKPPTASPTSMPTSVVIRERILWLARAVQSLRRLCVRDGLTLPARVTVRTGDLTRTPTGPAMGQCWPSARTTERVPGIIIDHSLRDAVDVLATLLHELIHAADDCRSQHGPWFAAWAHALGLVGLPSTTPGPALRRELQQLARALGSYPRPEYGFVIYTTGRVQA